MSIFLVLIIQLFVLNFFKIAGNEIGSIIQLLSKIIIVILFAYSLPSLIIKNTYIIVITYFLAFTIIIFNFLIFPQNIEVLERQLFDFLGICLVCFIYSYSIDDIDKLMYIYGKISMAIFYIGLVIGILTITNIISLGLYNMPYSYYMLIPAIFYLNKILKKNNFKSLIIFFVILFFIILFGSRGPLFCIAVYFILFLIINIQFKTVRKVLIFLVATSSTLLLWIFRNYLISTITRLIGVNSRTLTLFSENILYTGRESIYSTLIELISKNPLIGIGLGGDRLYLGKYSHNIFLEIISGFGIIAGSIISIVLIFIISKSVFMKGKKQANINLIWFTLGFVPLLFSGSYLTSFSFWIYLGIAVKSITKYT
jgi:O-antigen ligase